MKISNLNEKLSVGVLLIIARLHSIANVIARVWFFIQYRSEIKNSNNLTSAILRSLCYFRKCKHRYSSKGTDVHKSAPLISQVLLSRSSQISNIIFLKCIQGITRPLSFCFVTFSINTMRFIVKFQLSFELRDNSKLFQLTIQTKNSTFPQIYLKTIHYWYCQLHAALNSVVL